jgi:WD40 repeat protein
MALSPDAMDLVTCSADGSTCVWDMEIGDCVLLLEGASAVTCVGLSLNAGLILTGTATGCINVWDLEGGVCKKVLKPHRVRCASPCSSIA